MLCPHCKAYINADDAVCSACGVPVSAQQEEEDSVLNIRQGRRAQQEKLNPQQARPRRAAGASHAFFEEDAADGAEQIPLYGGDDGVIASERLGARERYEREPRRRAARSMVAADEVDMPGEQAARHRMERALAEQRMEKRRNARNSTTNWAAVTLAIMAGVVALAAGCYFYLSETEHGNRLLVRMGRESTAQAVWAVGKEEMDVGNIGDAIDYFLMAREQDGEDGSSIMDLMTLGNAYEAAGMLQEAEAIYTEVFTTRDTKQTEAYSNVIRIMLADGRDAEAAELMALAYRETKQTMFHQQRTTLLPQMPLVDLAAGLYAEAKTLNLVSPQGYDVYYTTDPEAVLPDDGILINGPVTLEEGIHALRAVCVYGRLVSDELKGTYKVILPSPQSPRSSLAPNTYEKRQRIWLKPGLDDVKDTELKIYYTIDGSAPDADSPIFTGDPFYLPGGRVKLQAVAVNAHGKLSNTLVIDYKINAGPYPKDSWSSQETVSGMTLNTTSLNEFQEKNGTAVSTEEVWVEGFESMSEKHFYEWGYAVFAPKKNERVLVELYYTSQTFDAPRKTKIGDTEEEIVAAFRDMGQVTSPSGNRGLYANNNGSGKIFVVEGGKEIRYTTTTADNRIWQLTYSLNEKGVCTAINWKLMP